MGLSNAMLPTVYELSDPVTDDRLRALAADRDADVVQTSGPLDDTTWQRLDRLVLAHRPDLTVRVFGHYRGVCDLALVRHIPSVRRFAANVLHEVAHLDALSELPLLESLSIGVRALDSLDVLQRAPASLRELEVRATKAKRVSLAPLARFDALRSLHIEGHTKDIEVIASLRSLRRVMLRSVSAPVGALLASLPDLRDLHVGLGGKHALEPLRHHAALRRVELWRVRGLDDIGFLSDLPLLGELRLQALSGIVGLPPMSTSSVLRHVVITDVKDFRDVGSLAALPSLEALAFWGARALAPSDFAPLLASRTLREIAVGFGSLRKADIFEKMRAAAGLAPYERGERISYDEL